MSMQSTGGKLRQIRELLELPLRRVAVMIDVDVAVLSKMERGERKLTKDIVRKLANIYNYNENELLVLFLSDKIIYDLQGEELGIVTLKVAEDKIKLQNSKLKK